MLTLLLITITILCTLTAIVDALNKSPNSTTWAVLALMALLWLLADRHYSLLELQQLTLDNIRRSVNVIQWGCGG